jgi:predicted permease
MNTAVIVLPVFALIALGYLAARFDLLSAAGRKGLAEFATTLAIPALLFRTIAGSAQLPPAPARLWLAFFGSAAVAWLAATLTTRFVLRRPAADGASIAMTSTYGNTVMLGIPLCLGLYGELAAAPMAVILAIHSPLYWILATVHHQSAIQSSSIGIGGLLLKVGQDLARNPLVMAIVAALIWRATGLGLAAVPDRILGLLAQAGVPSALVALGTNLVGFAIAGQAATLTSVLVIKLLAMPAIAAGLAWSLGLSAVETGVVILFAAMPAGANAFLFANKVGRATNSASGAVALGTAASLVIAGVIVSWLGGGR